MATFQARLKLEGFDQLANGLNPHKLMSRLRPLFRKENIKLGLILKKKLVEAIDTKGNFAVNAYATTIFKGSSKPLVADGDLRRNCGKRLIGSFAFIVGTTRKNRKGVDLAAVLHEGAEIPVTPRMRKVWIAMCAKHEMKVKPLRKSTTKIVIPPRPFLKQALIDDPAVAKIVLLGWKRAMMKAHKQFGARLI